MCEKEHSGHKSITYGSILPDMKEANNELKNLKQTIDEYKKEINKIIEKLKNYMNNLDIYYKISYDIINNYENKKRNYPILQNINDINDFMKNLNKIISENSIVNKMDNIISIFYKDLEEMKEKDYDKEKKINKKEELKEKEITKIKEEENSGNIKEEENENEEIQKYNPSDDKFEDFDITGLKEIKKFETNYNIKKLIVLKDQRILFYQIFYDKDEKKNYSFSVYDTNNNFNCDFSLETNKVSEIFQMNDGNIIIYYNWFSDSKIKVVKVKKKCFENIQELKDTNYNIYKISEKRIITSYYEKFQFYSYEKGKLMSKKNIEVVKCIYDICNINDSEIAIYYYKDGKFYGYNAFLLFYDILYYEKIKTLKLGDGEKGNLIKLINENTLILDRNSKM